MILSLLVYLSFLVGNLLKLSVFPESRLSLLDLTSGLIVLFNCRRLRFQPEIWLFAALAGLSLINFGPTFGPAPLLVGSLYLFRWLVYSHLAFVLPRQVKPEILIAVLVVTGLVQYLVVPDIRPLQALNWDPHYFRLVGSFLDPGFTGLLLCLGLLYLSLHPSSHPVFGPFAWIATYLAMMLTYSRTTYLAFLVAFVLLSLKRRSVGFFICICLIFGLTLAVLPRPGGEGVRLERDSTIRARLQNWQNSLVIFADHPILGVGFNVYRYAQRDYGFLGTDWRENHAGAGADSSLFFVAATTGTLGLAAYLWFLKRFYLDSIPLYVTPVLVHSFFLNSLMYPAVLFLLAVFLFRARDYKSA